MKYKIYKLVYQGEVIYIGCTRNELKIRFRSNHDSVPKEIKKECSIELIEETDDISREEYWRLYYVNLGCKLYNRRRGITGLTREEYINEYNISNQRKENGKKYYEKWKDIIIERTKEYRKRYNESNKEKRREYLNKNKEQIRERQREYYKRKKNEKGDI